jgi:hypothetical protein
MKAKLSLKEDYLMNPLNSKKGTEEEKQRTRGSSKDFFTFKKDLPDNLNQRYSYMKRNSKKISTYHEPITNRA